MEYCFDYISKGLRDLIAPATRISHFFAEPLSFRVFKNAYIAPFFDWEQSIGGVIDESGKAVKDSGCFEWKEDAFPYQLNCAERKHKRVIYLGFLVTSFGHSYTDDLRKLWFLNTDNYSTLRDTGFELVYTTSWNRPLSSAILDIIELSGFNLENAHHITHLTHFDEVIIPDNCIKAKEIGRVYCYEYKCMINHIISSIPDGGLVYPKLYFTRTHFTNGSNKEQGEEDIERIFSRLGYSIIAPEEYAVSEQLRMVRNCTHFASTEGSVSHMSMFCKKGTDVILINKANYLNFHQVMINEFSDLKITYIEAHHSSKAHESFPWWGPFYLCVTPFVERFLGHRVFHLPYWARFSYWKYTRNLIYRAHNKTRRVLKWFLSSR